MDDIYQYATTNRQELQPFLPKTYKRVLEIGCGTGGFKEVLGSDAEIWGIEPDKSAAEAAAKRGYKVLQGLYDEVCDWCPNGYFDLIVCNDVIEHMVDHDSFLENIKPKMSENAYLFGSIPNVRYFGNLYKLLVKKDWHYENHGILDRTHLRFFTEKSLSNTFGAHGYGLEQIRGINSDFNKWTRLSNWLRNIVLGLLVAVTLGHCKDIQYMQFVFRLKLTK